MGKKQIILYVASSLDGFIARTNGDVDWLFTDQDYGYSDFYEIIRTIIMGNTTYQQVLTFGDFPYIDKDYFVFSRNKNNVTDEHVTFVHEDVTEFIEQLSPKDDKKIWLVGGAMIIAEFLKYDLIDEFIISIHPVLLGNGIPLLNEIPREKKLKFIDVRTFDTGLVQVYYARNGT